MEARALREGWVTPERGQRFETRTPKQELVARIERHGDASIMDRLVLSVFCGLESTDDRTVGIACRNAIAMERANQRDEQHADDLKLKQAIVEQRGGHVDESIPTGVVLLSRPCTSVEEWQAEVAADLASDD